MYSTVYLSRIKHQWQDFHLFEIFCILAAELAIQPHYAFLMPRRFAIDSLLNRLYQLFVFFHYIQETVRTNLLNVLRSFRKEVLKTLKRNFFIKRKCLETLPSLCSLIDRMERRIEQSI